MKDHPIYGWLVYLALAFAAYFAWNGTGEDDEDDDEEQPKGYPRKNGQLFFFVKIKDQGLTWGKTSGQFRLRRNSPLSRKTQVTECKYAHIKTQIKNPTRINGMGYILQARLGFTWIQRQHFYISGRGWVFTYGLEICMYVTGAYWVSRCKW